MMDGERMIVLEGGLVKHQVRVRMGDADASEKGARAQLERDHIDGQAARTIG